MTVIERAWWNPDDAAHEMSDLQCGVYEADYSCGCMVSVTGSRYCKQHRPKRNGDVKKLMLDYLAGKVGETMTPPRWSERMSDLPTLVKRCPHTHKCDCPMTILHRPGACLPCLQLAWDTMEQKLNTAIKAAALSVAGSDIPTEMLEAVSRIVLLESKLAQVTGALRKVCKDKLPDCDPEGWGTCTCSCNEPIKTALGGTP